MHSPLNLALASLAALCLLAACSPGSRDAAADRSPDAASLRVAPAGEFVGFAAPRGNHAWLGIPFAKPPVGDLRWRAPQAAAAASERRLALQVASACPQFANPLATGGGAERDGIIGDEDCLYLNVFAPRIAPEALPKGGARLPVMVWIHGGGNTVGHGGSYDAGALAQEQNVIVVTTNYRLGVLGWLRHPALAAAGASAGDRSGNYGTLDLIRSLEWVRDNIGAFGGDAKNVTIFGESAGGHNVFTLLVAPRAKDLFARAISQSGGTWLETVARAERYSDDEPAGGEHSSREIVLARLILDAAATDRAGAKKHADAMPAPDLAAYLRGQSVPELFAVLESDGPFGMYRSPRVFGDGSVLPNKPIPELIASGRYNRVPVLLGTNRDEVKLFMSGSPELVQRVLWFLPRVRDPRAYDLSAEYQSALWKASGADEPAAAMVASGNRNVFVYRFDWDEEGTRLWITDLSQLIGAGHGVEIPFVFDAFGSGAFARLFAPGSDPGREGLGKAMRSYWAEFARKGDPGTGGGDLPRWSAWSRDAAGEKFALLDSEAGGGIRMSRDSVTRTGVLDAIASDSRFTGAAERCRLYADLVTFSDLKAEEYAARDCGAFPLADVAAR